MAIPKKNKAAEEPSPRLHLSERYPDPAVEVLDPSFAKYRIFNAAVERLASGMRWSEGPVWFGGGRYLLWSDLPNNRIMKWEEGTGQVIVFCKPANYANGNTQDRQGRLVTCKHGARRVTRQIVLLTLLEAGQEATVLQLPATAVVGSQLPQPLTYVQLPPMSQ